MATGSNTTTDNTPPLEYSTQELGQMMFDITIRMANNEKKTQSNRFEQEAFARQQALANKNVDEHMSKLLQAIENLSRRPPDPPPAAASSRGWNLPPSRVIKPVGFVPEAWPKLRFDPPRFNGENVIVWIKKIQKYCNHNFTPLPDRLYLTEFLLDESAAEWFGY